jgi:hypothetical protein
MVTRNLAAESFSCEASSSAVLSGLTVVLMPPSDATVRNATAYSGRFGE